MVNVARGTGIITRDQLQRVAPSVFATEPWHKMSDRYGFIPTIDVVDALADRGFYPVRAQQGRSRIEGKANFTRHMIRFRRERDLNRAAVVGEEVAELVLSNAHDGTSVYNFEAGIFRFVCANGMVVASGDIGSARIKHHGSNDFHVRVTDATSQIMDNADRVLGSVQDWKQITLSPDHRNAYAMAARELRPDAPVIPRQLLAPRRREDVKADLWTTTNVIQENTLRGGIRGRSETGRRMTTREIKNVAEDLRLNRALWVLAEEMAKIAG
jgi:enamine deaminase RidA (YjgF/YER057c/UK114 family)